MLLKQTAKQKIVMTMSLKTFRGARMLLGCNNTKNTTIMNKNILFAFLGGAIVGAGAALLFAPEKGSDLRADIKKMLNKAGLCNCKNCECDTVVDEIIEQVGN